MARAVALAREEYAEDEEGMEEAAEPKQGKGMDDSDLLSILAAERMASVGFENGTELEKKRKQALDYSKGVMSDVPALANRSKAVSTDVIDAIETVMPELMEIFTGGEDVASFDPTGEEDEAGAQQESDYINYVAFRKLPGWRLLYTAIKDALQNDTGIIETWWEDNEVTEQETLEGVTVLQLQKMIESGLNIVAQEQIDAAPDGTELYNVTIENSYDKGCIKSAAIDPSNLSVGADTIDIADATYCVVRSYPRAQALIDQGFDADLVDKLSEYTIRGNENTEQSRDLAGETESTSQGSGGTTTTNSANRSPMRTVEVHKHWIRIDANGDGKTELWRIQTDADCTVILDKREVSRIGLATGTPFIQTHRFYGMSLAEKLTEIQKIKTALLRLMLDSGYFAMNQRMEVSTTQSDENTIKDLMRNEPGIPVRSKTGTAVRAISAGQLGFDVGMAMEYASTMGEGRSGVVRNAQGLNPDTLHDTAKGAMALMSMAQKRIRMIARVFAETLVKKWYLDIHALSRQHSTRAEKLRLRGRYVDIDPSSFGDRADMVIEVGVGSGGKEMELAALARILEFQEKAMTAAGGEAPIATWQNAFNALARFSERAGFKAPEKFFTNPETTKAKKDEENAKRQAAGQPPVEEPPEPPSPEEIKVKGELELQTKKHQDAMQLEGQKAQAKQVAEQQQAVVNAQRQQEQAAADAQLKREQMALDQQNKREQMALDAQLKREQQAADHQIKREQLAGELELKRQQLVAELEMNREIEMAKLAAGVVAGAGAANGSATSGVHLGGEAGA